MTRKRKRAGTRGDDAAGPRKRKAYDNLKDSNADQKVEHPTLALYYPQIFTLRNYLLSKLPNTSKTRRRRLVDAGATQIEPIASIEPKLDTGAQRHLGDDTSDLAKVLDRTLVCVTGAQGVDSSRRWAADFESFSQQTSLTAGSSTGKGISSQCELVDFAIWLLFHKVHRTSHKPPHMLCHGYQRASTPRHANDEYCAAAGIPGIISRFPNNNVNLVKNAAWADILALLGKEGDEIMLSALIDCSLFTAIDLGTGNFYQLSGVPLTDIKPLASGRMPKVMREPQLTLALGDQVLESNIGQVKHINLRSPIEITFVRNRMFYARAALNAKGKVTFGLRHIHALNRYCDSSTTAQTIHLMKYVFPRQFGLHNVFTSTVDPRETVQTFKDYTLREQEIAQAERRTALQGISGSNRLEQCPPRRLRGELFRLMQKFQKLHSRCSYRKLLDFYCPIRASHPAEPSQSQCRQSHIDSLSTAKLHELNETSLSTHLSNKACPKTQVPVISTGARGISRGSLVDFATPQSEVSAYCRAVVSNVIPNQFWGANESGHLNTRAVMQRIDQFIQLRRFESMTLHAVFQNQKLSTISWLAPPKVGQARSSRSDMEKRKEIYLEFLYYVFDSIVIPLVRSNFHVTESNVHQNRLFYFRHDVWRALTEPAIIGIKSTMFEEVKTSTARKLLDARTLGFSQIRLLPKAKGLRPITNLRRRITKLQNGRVALGRSINSIMAPAFNILDFEKTRHPALVGSALFSVGDMYPKLKAFAERLCIRGTAARPLYFVKADAKSCFDTIPQRRVLKLMRQITREDRYRISRHSEIKSTTVPGTEKYAGKSKAARKFISSARAAADFSDFEQFVQAGRAARKNNTIFVDSIVQTIQRKENVMGLLEEHIQRNLIKMGKKFFRQKAGIPQGSVLSSLLCNFFYAGLEEDCLAFLCADESILLRLIDDFLVITTNMAHAKKFLQIMHNGVEDYGVEVNPSKSLANFDVSINGARIPRLLGSRKFPYCGNLIDVGTLEITKDRERRTATVLANTLTVEQYATPGRTFYRKALNALKIQIHKMFLDTNFNSPSTVLCTIYQNFVEAAMKYYRYVKSMKQAQHPRFALLTGTIRDLVNLAFVLIKAKHQDRGPTQADYYCAVNKQQVQWLAAKAFRNTLGRKQSKFAAVVDWLDRVMVEETALAPQEKLRLNKIATQGDSVFRGYKY